MNEQELKRVKELLDDAVLAYPNSQCLELLQEARILLEKK